MMKSLTIGSDPHGGGEFTSLNFSELATNGPSPQERGAARSKVRNESYKRKMTD
jgi:hypothetical protein